MQVIAVVPGPSSSSAESPVSPVSCSKKPLITQMKEAVAKKKTCSHCSKVFRRRYDLQAHVKSVHSTPMKSKCEHACTFPTCDKRYATKDRLREHVKRVHLGAHKAHICKFCNKGFERKGRMEKHMASACSKRPGAVSAETL